MNKAQGTDGARNGCKGGRNPAPVRMQENRHGLETHFSTPCGNPRLSLLGNVSRLTGVVAKVHRLGYENPASSITSHGTPGLDPMLAVRCIKSPSTHVRRVWGIM